MRTPWEVVAVLALAGVSPNATLRAREALPKVPESVAATTHANPSAPMTLRVMGDSEMAVVRGNGDTVEWAVCGGLGIFTGLFSGSPWHGLAANALCHYVWNKIEEQ